MSKNLFTPGPWKTDFKMHAQFEKNSHVHLLTDSEGFNIGLLSSWVDDPVTRAEASANARLIAAAPQLYADLEAAAAQLRKYEVLHTLKNTPDSLEKARVNAELAERFESTLAAARGEA